MAQPGSRVPPGRVDDSQVTARHAIRRAPHTRRRTGALRTARATSFAVGAAIALGCLTTTGPAGATPAPAPAPAPMTSTDPQLADLQNRVAHLEAQLSTQQLDVANAKAGLDALNIQLDSAREAEAVALEAEQNARRQADEQAALADQARSRAAQARSSLGRSATRTYITGQTTELSVLAGMVDAKDGNDIAHALAGQRLVTERRARTLDDLRAAERDQAAASAQSKSAADQAASAAADARTARERTEQLVATQEAAVTTAEQRLGQTEEEVRATGLQVATRQAAVNALVAGSQGAATPAPVPAGSVQEKVMNDAAALSGIYYIYGGTSTAGFDCSGFTGYVMRQSGVNLPRTAAQQQAFATKVTDPQPGDLVFFGYPAYHVGIYAGNGMMYDSPRTGKTTGLHKVYSSVSSYGRVLPGA